MYLVRSSNVCRGLGYGAFVLLLLSAALGAAAESPSKGGAAGGTAVPSAPTYPRTLPADEMRRHFGQNPKISAKADGVGNYRSFTLKFKSSGWYDGIVAQGGHPFAGKWRISDADSKLCLTTSSTLNGTIDLTGCYVMQQIGEQSFALAAKGAWMAYGDLTEVARFGGSRNKPRIDPASPEDIAEPIRINIIGRQVTPELFKAAATRALITRGWNITSSTADQIDASLFKHKEFRVSIAYRKATEIKISFVQGYGHSSQSWLRNLEKDMEREFIIAGSM